MHCDCCNSRRKDSRGTPSFFGMIFLWILFSFVCTVGAFKLEPIDRGFIFEGDMIMSKEEIEAALDGKDVDNPNQDALFGLMKTLRRKWPNAVVPYVLSDSVKSAALNKVGSEGPTEKVILSAIKEWEEKTCIRFKPRTVERDYIEFIDGGFGRCYTHVGRTGGKQKLSLGFGCVQHGIALHEIGHALGLYHEQSRPDRDDYVEIIWDKIMDGFKLNFKKYTHSMVDSQGSPYDYGSIMHYGKSAFAKRPYETTIKTKDPNAIIGQRSHLSEQDAAQIKKLYQCV